MKYQLLILLTSLSFSFPVAADIYTYHNEDGQLYFTDKRMGDSYKLISIYRPQLTRQSTADYSLKKYKSNQKKFLPHIRYAAIQHRLDYKLLQAIIDTESAFNPQAYSKAGAVGLMQLMPNTAKALHVQNSWNPVQNIQGGAKYFRQMLNTFGQDVELSLAAYNAGPNAVKRAGNSIPNYPETKRYVKKVMQTYRKLQTSS